MIVIIDYGMGNLRSVQKAFEKVGHQAVVTSDPAQVAASIAAIPQVHFIGGRDDVVPAEVSRSYFRRIEAQGQARLVTKDSFGHVCCWADDWQSLSRDPALAAIPGWRQGRG